MRKVDDVEKKWEKLGKKKIMTEIVAIAWLPVDHLMVTNQPPMP